MEFYYQFHPHTPAPPPVVYKWGGRGGGLGGSKEVEEEEEEEEEDSDWQQDVASWAHDASSRDASWSDQSSSSWHPHAPPHTCAHPPAQQLSNSARLKAERLRLRLMRVEASCLCNLLFLALMHCQARQTADQASLVLLHPPPPLAGGSGNGEHGGLLIVLVDLLYRAGATSPKGSAASSSKAAHVNARFPVRRLPSLPQRPFSVNAQLDLT